MTRLSVNVNKIATLRNARGGALPDLVAVSRDILSFGAQGLTIHPRPDERHIRNSDLGPLRAIAAAGGVEFNMEGYPDARFMSLVEKHRPEQATFVPDAPDVLTSNAGWCLNKRTDFLQEAVHVLKGWGVRASLFIEASGDDVVAAATLGADAVELYTGPYAKAYALGGRSAAIAALRPFVAAAKKAQALNLSVHAGHDLNLVNIELLIHSLAQVNEVSVGHALVCEALYDGLQNVIGGYLERIARARTHTHRT